MASYNIFIKRSAEKEVLSVPKQDRLRIVAKIRKLAHDPRPQGCEKLREGVLYRIRQGDWRIVYAISDEDKLVTIIKVGHRREVYR